MTKDYARTREECTDDESDDSEADWALTDDQKDTSQVIREAMDRAQEEMEQMTMSMEQCDNPNTSGASDGTNMDPVQETYREALGKFSLYKDSYNAVLDEVNTSLTAVNKLLETYNEVSTRTSSLHEACDQLMSDQTQLAASAEDIRNRLTYFSTVETLMHKLSSPMLTVTSEAFTQLLNSVDGSLAFLSEHLDYKETELYRAKYQQCLSRALTLVRSHVRQTLKVSQDAVADKRAAQQQLSEDRPPHHEDLFTLYYGIFGAQAASIRNLMENLEARANQQEAQHSMTSAVEYKSMLLDCHRMYFDIRAGLMMSSIRVTVQGLSTKYLKNPCTLLRSACTFLLRVCEDEATLYHRFFGDATFTIPNTALGSTPTSVADSDETNPLSDFLEHICGPLYDVARPIIIHSTHLEALAELCLILKHEMIDERCGDEDEATIGFVRVANELLGDVRERLVYRAQEYARNDIMGYTPAPGDLAYPEKLEMMQEIALKQQEQKPQEESEPKDVPDTTEEEGKTEARMRGFSTSTFDFAAIQSSKNAGTTISPADIHGFWYPPVRRTILCLSKLYKSLDPVVFQGLSQDITMLCIRALNQATANLEARIKNPLDPKLFLLKHLLILREQTAPFRQPSYDSVIQHSSSGASQYGGSTVSAMSSNKMSIRDTSMDFDKIRSQATSVFTTHRGRLFSMGPNNALVEFFLNAPKQTVNETVEGTGRAIDLELRKVCHDFISQTAPSILLAPELKQFLCDATAFLDAERKQHAEAKLATPDTASDEEEDTPGVHAPGPPPPKPQPMSALSKQPFGKVQAVKQVSATAYRTLKTSWRLLIKAVSLYLANKDTEAVFISHIRRAVTTEFSRFRNLVNTGTAAAGSPNAASQPGSSILMVYSPEDAQVISPPSAEQISVLLLADYSPKTDGPTVRFADQEPSDIEAANDTTTTDHVGGEKQAHFEDASAEANGLRNGQNVEVGVFNGITDDVQPGEGV